METLRATQKKYGSRALTAAILISLILMLFGFKSLGKGLILGTLFSVINFILMGETLPLRLGRSPKGAVLAALGSILLRYTLLAVPLAAALHFPQIHFFGVVVGLFAVQTAILGEHLTALFTAARTKNQKPLADPVNHGRFR